MRRKNGLALSLFSGAGGLDKGVEDAGFTVGSAVEWDADSADTMERNFPSLQSPVIRKDIRQVETDEILAAAGLARGESPDLLVGGPPCVAFSKSGFWLDYKRAGDDPAAGLLHAYTRVLREARPRAFIMENVYALTFKNSQSRPHFNRLLEEIEAAGYECRWAVLNAADYGVPQLRPRVFVIGLREGGIPRFPEPTHGGKWERRETGGGELPHVTAGEALDNLIAVPEPAESVNGQFGGLLKDVPPGDNYLFYTEKRGHPKPLFKWRSRYWTFLLKLSPEKPASTIQAQPGPYVGPFHWENRRLRVPELRRLFTYPDNFEFVGSRSSLQKQIGNSVPPLLARLVAEEVAAQV